MYSVHTVTPEIHFPGYCPSPIPEYVESQKRSYREPPLHAFDRDYVREHLVETKPWFPVPDEPDLCVHHLSMNVFAIVGRRIVPAFRTIVASEHNQVISALSSGAAGPVGKMGRHAGPNGLMVCYTWR